VSSFDEGTLLDGTFKRGEMPQRSTGGSGRTEERRLRRTSDIQLRLPTAASRSRASTALIEDVAITNLTCATS
jgi:hypothetical protein